MTKSTRSKFVLKIRHPNDRFFYFKFCILGVLTVKKMHKKFGGPISKIVDFFLLSNFC